MVFPRVTTAAGLTLCLSVWPRAAHAQLAIPAPIAPPSQSGVVAVQPIIPGGTLQPIQPTTPPNTDNQTQISASAVTAPALMAQIEAGRLTPAQAWANGALTVPDLLYILDRYISEWGFIGGANQVELRRDLAKLLVEHGGEVLTKPAALPAKARLWLTDYLMSIGDSRAVTMGESILSEVKAPVGNEESLVFQTIERLGGYYRAKGEMTRGAQTWLHMRDYYTPQSRFVPDALVEAARLEVQAGDFKQAQELYEQVPKYGNGWYSGLALYEQAQQLISQGHHAEARKLLAQPVTGVEAEQSRVAMLSLLGYSYFQTEEFEAARKYDQEAIIQYAALKNLAQGKGIESLVEESKSRLLTLDKWKSKSFEVPLRKLPAVRSQDGIYHARLYVHSFKPQPLAVRFKADAAHLVALRQQSQQRTDSGVVVTIYDLAYQTDAHPLSLEAQVYASATPQDQQTLELHQDEGGD